MSFRANAIEWGLGLRLAGLTVAMVSAVYGADLAVGVPSAFACAPPQNGFTAVRILNAEASQPLAVANDGFFAIAVNGNFGEPAGALTQLVVVVTNADGGVVSGSLHTLPERTQVYWVADAPLADGAYTAVVSAPGNAPPIEIRQPLAVHGAPSPLALAHIEPSEWLEFRSLTGGTRLSCSPAGSCGPIEFGELVESSPGVRVRVTAPPINGQVYWEVRLQPVGGSDPPQRGVFTGEGAAQEFISEVRFPQRLAEYCVELKMIDWRDNGELLSPQICWKPESSAIVDETAIVSSCPQSPSPALLPWWCKNRKNEPACAGVVSPDQGGGAGSAGAPSNLGSAGSASSSGAAGAAGSIANPPPPSGAAPDDDGSSSACSMGRPARSASGVGTVALLAFAALGRRRRHAIRALRRQRALSTRPKIAG